MMIDDAHCGALLLPEVYQVYSLMCYNNITLPGNTDCRVTICAVRRYTCGINWYTKCTSVGIRDIGQITHDYNNY